MFTADKVMNHAEHQRRTRRMDTAGLLFTIKDASEAIVANPDNPNNGYYQDEICYCGMEVKRRHQMANFRK